MFGEAALSLKHGKLALAIEKGRVIRVERTEIAVGNGTLS
jgi:ribonuclease D